MYPRIPPRPDASCHSFTSSTSFNSFTSFTLPHCSHLTPFSSIISALFSLYLSSGSPATPLESSAHTLFPCTTEGVAGAGSTGCGLYLQPAKNWSPPEKEMPAGAKLRRQRASEKDASPERATRAEGSLFSSRAFDEVRVLTLAESVRLPLPPKTMSVHESDELTHMESHSCIKPPGEGYKANIRRRMFVLSEQREPKDLSSESNIRRKRDAIGVLGFVFANPALKVGSQGLYLQTLRNLSDSFCHFKKSIVVFSRCCALFDRNMGVGGCGAKTNQFLWRDRCRSIPGS